MNKTPRTLKRRMNVPLPVMSGFIDTLVAKIDDPPSITINPTELADLPKARKSTALMRVDSSPTRGMWDIKDILGKKMAAFSGRAVYQTYAESDPRYKHHLELVDTFDFVCEPGGGWHLETHFFLGKVNVFRTKAELQEGVENGWYDGNQVSKLINAQTMMKAEERTEMELRRQRLQNLGLNLDAHSYTGQDIYNFTEWRMVHEGTRYCLLFEPKTGIWIRAHEFDDVFERRKDEPPLWDFTSWATHYEPYTFWSKAPADDVYPIHEAMGVTFNEGLMNLRRRNWNMRAVDGDVFPDLSLLEWREDGIVPVSGLNGRAISSGIYEFNVPDTTNITVNLIEFMNGFLGQKTGITPDVQGAADDNQKVGIYFGQLQQVADRLGLYNKFYRQCWTEIAQRYIRGLRQHATEGMVVKMIGSQGGEWEEFTREDANPISDFDIEIAGGSAQSQLDEIKKKQKADALTRVTANPNTLTLLSPKWLIEEELRTGGFEEHEIKQAMDTKNDADQEILAEADQAVQDILAKKRPKMNRGATAAFIQYILDYALDNVPMDKPDLFNALTTYAQAHMDIAIQNAAREIALTPGAMEAAGPMGAPSAGVEEVSATTPGSFVNSLPPEMTPTRVTRRGTVRAEELPV